MRATPPCDLDLLPDQPGIYKMSDSQGVLLYVGKAKNIRKRVKSYFQNPDRLDTKTIHLVSHIAGIQTIVVRSEAEALLLEAQLIKEFQPRYNILLKDDKAFPYIKITGEIFPRLMIVRDRLRDGALYFGPYPSIGSTKALRRMLHDIFKLRDCSQVITLEQNQPKCIKLDINKCLGPCVLKHVHAEYTEIIQQLKKILTGKNRQLISEMRVTMQAFADARQYEKAALWRDRILKIEQLGQRQAVRIDAEGCIQLWTAAEERNFLYIVVQTLVDGKLLYQRGYYLENPTEGSREEMVQQSVLTSQEEDAIPDLLLCDPWLEQVLSRLMSTEVVQKIPMSVPKRGIKLELLAMARQNARLAISRIIKDRSIGTVERKGEDIVQLAESVLGLRRPPRRIIGVDISHLQGTNIVASAVYFKEGNPWKSGYRKLKIRSVSGDSNDPQSIYEAVSRRVQLCFTDHEPLPDLLVIDGGKGQLNFAFKALVELGVENEIDILSIAKKNEEIFRIDQPNSLVLSKEHSVLKLIQWVRDESHRFAVTFQRKRRRSDLEKGLLHSIPGLGPKRIERLYAHFYSVSELLKAADREIADVGGFSIDLVSLIRSKITLSVNP